LYGILKDIYALIRRKIKVLLLVSFLGGVLGIVYAYVKKPKYEAHLSFLVNENEQAFNISSLAGLAGLGGIGGGAGGSVNEDKLLFLTTSRFIIGSTLLSEMAVDGKNHILANVFIDTYKMQPGFKSDTALENFTYFSNKHIDSLTYQENKVLDAIIKIITDGKMLKSEVKKKAGIVAQNAGIVVIDFVSNHEGFSKSFIDNMYEILSVYYVNKTIQRQLHNYTLIKARADSVKTVLSSRENAGAAFVDQNMDIAKMAARLNVERARRDIEMLSLMYAEVLKHVEIAKFSLDNQTPFLQLVDYPTYPLKTKKQSKILWGIIGAIALGGLTLFWFVIKEYLNIGEEKATVSSL